jgi:hypothetical protein
MVHGLTAAQLGARAGLTEDVVWKAERSLPVQDITAVRLAKALGVKLEDIATPPVAVLDAERTPRWLQQPSTTPRPRDTSERRWITNCLSAISTGTLRQPRYTPRWPWRPVR